MQEEVVLFNPSPSPAHQPPPCAPPSQKHEILINGFGWATQRHFQKNVLPDVRPSPLAFFDYRCHAAGGAVGTAFPGALPTCLAKLGGKDGLRNALDLGFSRRHAEHLAARAALLVEQGLEGAIASLAEARPAADRIPLQPACCAVNSQGFCATEFRPDLGNGTLREWQKEARPPPAPLRRSALRLGEE